ncbi:hypothetical protein FRX31_004140 [Thalictrum thalictroides]|uniref:Uncharacterized protein n=1 Tax=Thalictrum thalictroides TaxID=46969 RepID=A0A7J6X9Z1_THATH|nr:hypothetical protein FRX31_004140 [Thalictrum thalictroides]
MNHLNHLLILKLFAIFFFPVDFDFWIYRINNNQSSRMLKLSQGQAKLEMPYLDYESSESSSYSQAFCHFFLPSRFRFLDLQNQQQSAVTSCAKDVKGLNVWDCSTSDIEVQVFNSLWPAQKFHMWVLSTVPTLAHCFTQYVHAMIRRLAILEVLSFPFSFSLPITKLVKFLFYCKHFSYLDGERIEIAVKPKKAADVFLWRNKIFSTGVLGVATAIWVSVSNSQYLPSLLRFLLL